MMHRHTNNEISQEAEARQAYAEGHINYQELMNFLGYLAGRGRQVTKNVTGKGRYTGPRL